MLSFNRVPLLVVAGALPVAFLMVVSCSSENSNGGSGGSSAAGGANAAGGAASGGTSTTGGATTASGGMSGGAVGNGGATGSGGSGTGGSNASGGSSGGTSSSGGAANGGAANGGANAGSSNGGTAGTSGVGGKNDGGQSNGGGSSGASGSGGGNNVTDFKLTSPNLTEGATFASKYTCAEKGFSGSVMPALNWTDGPPNTKSYAITFIDVTLAHGTPPDSKGYHWVIWNIPVSVKSLPEALSDAQVKALPAKENSAFLGPCPNFGTAPPTGSKTDTYEFTLCALSTETIDISGSNVVQAAETKLEANNLAKTKLTGKSNAASNK
jgi:Raf kinase inhibitor-like YbhB/YbcL family protein